MSQDKITKDEGSSSETKIFMAKITIEIKHIKEKLDKIPTKEEMKLANKDLVEQVFRVADKRYAGRRVENIVYGMLGIIVVWVLNNALNLL